MKKLISRKPRSARPISRRHNRLQMEALERRDLLAVVAGNDTYNTVENTSFTSGFVIQNAVPFRSQWSRFEGILRNTGTYPAANWNQQGYDQAGWTAAATAPFSAGTIDYFANNAIPVTPLTNSAAGQYIGPGSTMSTVLFRTTFDGGAVGGVTSGTGRYLCDDGCVVYVNGTEVFRNSSMAAAGTPVPASATSAGTGQGEAALTNFTWSGATINPGPGNVLAVSLHQDAAVGSTDIGFEMELNIAVPAGEPGTRANDSATGATNPADLRTYYFNSTDGDPIGAQRTTGFAFDANPANNGSPVGTVTIDPVSGNFTYTPINRTFNGQATFEYLLVDSAAPTGDGNVALAMVTINVAPVNVPPTGTADAYQGIEGQSFSITDPGASNEYISRGDRWFYNDSATDQMAAMTNPTFDPQAAGWFSGPAELGFGDGDEQMLLTRTVGQATYYFARKFDVPGAVPNLMRIQMRFDDGAVVRINGVEVVRSFNMPAAPTVIDNATFATAENSSETTFFEFLVPTAGLNLQPTGNTITVSIHQNNGTSSDISFNMSLAAAEAPLINAGATWFYRDDGTDQSATIRSPSFAPETSGWASGPAQLGFGDGDEATVITGPAHTTYYFARRFDLNTATPPPTLLVELLRDDGGIVYINGVEVVRDNMPSGPVDNTTFSAADAGSETTYFQHFIDTAGLNLQPTGNLITVEIHQATAGSSDVSFDLRLQGRNRVGLLANDPRDADGDAISLASVDTSTFTNARGQALGTINANPNGTFTFNANTGIAGTGTFTYRLTDGTDLSAPIPVTITLTPVDDGPVVAVNDSFTVAEDSVSVLINDPAIGNGIGVGVLRNDTTAPGDQFDPVTIALVRAPDKGGTVVFNNDGSFTYTAPLNYFGTETFDYVVDDGFSLSNVATVTMTITPVADLPTAAADFYTMSQGTTLNATVTSALIRTRSQWSYLDEMTNGSGGSPLEAYPLDGASNAWNTHAFNTATSDPTIGTWKTGFGPFAQPLAGLTPGGTTLLVNTAATVTTDLFRRQFTLTAGEASSITSLLAEMVYDDGIVLYINGTEIYRSPMMPPAPTAIASNTFATGTEQEEYVRVRLTIPAGVLQAGANTIAAEVHQNNLTSSDRGFDLGLYNVPVGSAQSVLLNDFDVDLQDVSAGTATLVADVTPSGTLVLNTNGTFSYTPLPTFTGNATFTYTITANGETSAAGTVTITVTTPPVVGVNDPYSTPVDQILFVNSPGVLSNDLGGTLPLSVLVDPAAAANDDTVVLPQGSLIWLDTAGANDNRLGQGGFAFLPNTGFQGTVNYVYTVVDSSTPRASSTATLTITVGSGGVTFDLNGDSLINLADMARIVSNLGTTTGATNAMGDVNGDGAVSIADVMLMRNRLGSAPPSPAAAVVTRGVDARAVDQAVNRLTDVRTRLDAREAAPRIQARVREIVRDRVSDARTNAGEAIDSALSAIRARRSAAATRAASIVDQLFAS